MFLLLRNKHSGALPQKNKNKRLTIQSRKRAGKNVELESVPGTCSKNSWLISKRSASSADPQHAQLITFKGRICGNN